MALTHVTFSSACRARRCPFPSRACFRVSIYAPARLRANLTARRCDLRKDPTLHHGTICIEVSASYLSARSLHAPVPPEDVVLGGEGICSDAVARYREEANALAHKRRLEAAGETAHVHPTVLHDFSELGLEQWFSD